MVVMRLCFPLPCHSCQTKVASDKEAWWAASHPGEQKARGTGKPACGPVLQCELARRLIGAHCCVLQLSDTRTAKFVRANLQPAAPRLLA